jgi:23S rRNA (pseudouridine1915-N3)-methyltransferase
MRISFYSVGKANEAYVAAGVSEFTSRVSRYFPCEWKLLSPAKHPGTPLEVMKQEGVTILDALQKEDYLVLLDERGKSFSSVQLANFIQTRANSSCRHLIFLIGGAFGVDDNVKARAQWTWSLSELVFPHQLVRLILAEQVYRACSIINNEKYHHS